VFPASGWPLHITVVPPFETERDAAAVAALIPRVPRIRLIAGERASFGSRGQVPVTLFEPSDALLAVHVALVDALEAAGARIQDQRHIRDGYRPHTSDQSGDALRPGAPVVIDALAVVAREPHGMRRVAARVPLRP
jgi:hypothetical protein